MHLKVWKPVACGSNASGVGVTQIPTQGLEGAGSENENDDSSSPAFPDSHLLRGTSHPSQLAFDAGQRALQGEAGVSFQTQPLFGEAKPISLQTTPLGSLTQSSMPSEATDALTGPPDHLAVPPQEFSPRQFKVARFRLAEKVHHGEMSMVWRAFDEVRQTHVAVKLVPRDLAPAFDAQTLARLVRVSQHPGLVTLIEHGWQDQWWYQIAEWIDGKTLSSLCRSTPVSAALAADLRIWMKQLAGALDAQHRAGFVHGDVKPSNVLVTSGQACLIDLVGLRTGASWTRHGGLTPAFASPEARKGAPADPRDDVYSLAAMIGKLLTGEAVTPERAADGSAPPPAGLTTAQWQVLRKALHPIRECRSESAIQLVDAMWPASAFPRQKSLPIPRRVKVAAAPGLSAQPRRPRRVHFGSQGSRVGEKGMLPAALAAVVVIALGTAHMIRSPAVPAIGAPTAEATRQWSRIEVEAQRNEVSSTASAFEPPATTSGAVARTPALREPLGTLALADSDVPSTELDVIPPVVLERAQVVATADPPRAREPDRTSSALSRTPAARELMGTPAVANSVGAPTEVAEQRDAMPAIVVEPAEVVATADALKEPEPDRPDASAFADRAEVPLLRDRAPATRTRTADRGDAHPLVMPAIFQTSEPASAIRADAVVAVSAVSDRRDAGSVPDRPETPTLLVALLDRPEQPERPDKPEHPDMLERPETIDKPDKPERPEIVERPDKVDRPEKPDRPELVARPDVVERPDKPERPEQIERPDKPERPELVARPDVPERPDKPERPEQIERPDKPERPELVARPEMPERPDKPEKPDKPDKPDKPERPERPS